MPEIKSHLLKMAVESEFELMRSYSRRRSSRNRKLDSRGREVTDISESDTVYNTSIRRAIMMTITAKPLAAVHHRSSCSPCTPFTPGLHVRPQHTHLQVQKAFEKTQGGLAVPSWRKRKNSQSCTRALLLSCFSLCVGCDAGRCERHHRSTVLQAAATLQDAPTQLDVSKVTPSLRGVKSSYTLAGGAMVLTCPCCETSGHYISSLLACCRWSPSATGY